MDNHIATLAHFFQSPGKPVYAEEFLVFWSSLSEEEKTYYRQVDLETGLPR